MNPSTGRTESDTNAAQGAPPRGAPEGADANKLAAAKEAAKKKLLRLVLQQAVDELGDPDAIADMALGDDALDSPVLQDLRDAVRDRIAHRVIARASAGDDTEWVEGAVAAATEGSALDSVAEQVQQRMLEDVSQRVLARMENDGEVVETLFGSIVGANEAAMDSLADDIRERVMQSVADRAWQESIDLDQLAARASSSLQPDHPGLAAAVDRIRETAEDVAVRSAIEAASTDENVDLLAGRVADQIGGQIGTMAVEDIMAGLDPAVIQRQTDLVQIKIAEEAALTLQRVLSESSLEEAIPGAAETVEAIRTRLFETMRDLAFEAATDADALQTLTDSVAEDVMEQVSADVSRTVASSDPSTIADAARDRIDSDDEVLVDAAELLQTQIVKDVASRAIEMLGAADALAQSARAMAETEVEAIEAATQAHVSMLSEAVATEVHRRARDVDYLAGAATAHVDPEAESVQAAARAVASDLGRLVALRAVESLISEDGHADIVMSATDSCAPQLDASTDKVADSLLAQIVSRVTDRFSDAGQTARLAKDRLGSDHAPLVAAGEVLKELVLEDLAKKATALMLDADEAAKRAFSRVDADDPRLVRTLEALRNLLEEAMAERSLEDLQDTEEAARIIRSLIPDDHEAIVGTAALVRDMLLDDIAERSESALDDARTVARQSRHRVPEDSQIITNAVDALREILLGDMVARTTSGLEDAEKAAEDAMSFVPAENEVIDRARAVLKERVLMNVVGEAIREISGSVSADSDGDQGGLVQKALVALASGEKVDSAPSPDSSTRPPRQKATHRTPAPQAAAPVTETAPAPKAAAPVTETAPVPDAATPVSEIAPAMEHDTGGPAAAPAVPDTIDEPADAAPDGATGDGPADLGSDGWIKLSDIEDEERMIPLDPPQALEEVIVTEFVDTPPSADDEAFAFAWSADDEAGSRLDGADDGDFDAARDGNSTSSDAATAGSADIDMTWSADDGTRCYVYGFVPVDETPHGSTPEVEGVESDASIRFVTVRDIRAAVSRVSSDDYGKEGMTARSRDKNWLRERIRAHARVLDAMKAGGTVLPVQFGTVYESESEVVAHILENHDSLESALGRLRGRSEWGVRATRNVDRMRSRILESGKTVDEALGSLSAGVAQFIRDELSKDGKLDEQALVETVTSHCLRRAHGAISNAALKQHEKLTGAGDNPGLVFNNAYLVDDAECPDFKAQVRQIAEEFEDIGLEFDVSGPWPAFHFTTDPENDTTDTESARM